MDDLETIPQYAAELARIAIFTIAEVQERHGADTARGRGMPHMPDEKDFELNFGLYLQRVILESEIRMGRRDLLYMLVIEKVIELADLDKEIDAIEIVRNLTGLVRKRKIPDAG